MGRLISGVREAEERLAGIARALQSAYEEELAEAVAARDAATRGLARARAMEHAARALGREELAQRSEEIARQFEAAESAARSRLAELEEVEKTVQARLGEVLPERPPAALPPRSAAARPPPPPPEAKSERTPARKPAPKPAAQSAPKPAPKSEPKAELERRLGQLEERLDELTRAAPRWPKEIAREAVQEHVALARLLEERLAHAAGGDAGAVEIALERLRELAALLAVGDVVGLSGEAAADWNKLAADARHKRQALVALHKKRS